MTKSLSSMFQVQSSKMYDVIIIGAGPAGLTAALYTGRNLLKTLVLSKDLGGQTAISGELGNYPGIELTDGLTFVNKMKKQIEKLKTLKIKIGPENEVTSLSKTKNIFEIINKKGEKFESKTVIVASGKTPKKLKVAGEKEFEGRGVSFCATCDAPLFKNKTVAVIGGGYSATEATYMLNKYAQTIYVLTINEVLRGEALTLEKVKSSPKVQIIPNASTSKILNDGIKVTGLEYKNTKTGKIKTLEVEGVFVEIGYQPNTKYFGDLVKLNQWQEIEIDHRNMTKVPGLFAAGDVTSVWGKQTIIAAGEGAKAAMAVGEYLVCGK